MTSVAQITEPTIRPVTDGLLLAVSIASGPSYPSAKQTREIAQQAYKLAHFPGSRIREFVEEILLGPRVETALQWLHDSGILGVILPKLDATVNFTQEVGRRHKDVWKHTKQVVGQSVPDVALRWAALLHDIGKVPTRVICTDGKVLFHGHAEVGARMFDSVARRLDFPQPLRKKVRFLIQHHLRANQYDGSWTDSAVRRFDREMSDHLEALLQLSKADITSARQHKRELALKQIDELWQRIITLREIDSRVPLLPSGLGNQIMQRFCLKPGRLIGKLHQELETAIEAGKLAAQQTPDYYLDYLEHHSQLLAGAIG